MACGGCENAVKRVLSKVDGVDSVTADHTASLVGVTFDPEKVTATVIREEIEGLGYDVAP
jgi:copper chaperone CopZ